MNLPSMAFRDGEMDDDAWIVQANGVELCVETFGDRGDPAILLVAGAASSMDWWESGFCRRLAGGGRYVVRYDHRDTGRSTNYESGSPPYGFDDLVADAVGLLDSLEVELAHVVGISMGGAIAQRLAVDHGHRVASLTLISTSPALRPNAPPNLDLPLMSAELLAHFIDPAPSPAPDPDWTNRAMVVDSIVASQHTMAGSCGFDDARLRQLAARVVGRTTDIAASLTNHWLIDAGASYRSRLGQITAPTLVIHGTEDPLFPYGHAEALAREIPGTRLLPLDGVGHQMPPPQTWELVIPALLRHSGEGGNAERAQ